MKNIAPGI